jgi:hypothetical protein
LTAAAAQSYSPAAMLGPAPYLAALAALASFAAFGVAARPAAAADPDAGEPAAVVEPASSGGPWVLLRNGNVLPGRAREEGEMIVIGSDEDSVVRIPAADVLCWAEDLRGLYRYRVDQRLVVTLQTHHADARWCLRQGLYDLAAAELIAAHRLHPDHPVTLSLEKELRSAVGARETPATAAESGVTKSGTPLSPAKPGEREQNAAEPQEPSAAVSEFDPQLLASFSARVQPLLLNRCNGGACHGERSDAAFQLLGGQAGSRPTADLTRQNLQSVLDWIDSRNPRQRRLLTEALAPHGGRSTAPLGAGDGSAIENLRRFIRQAAAASPGSAASSSSAGAPARRRELAAGPVPPRAPSDLAHDLAGNPPGRIEGERPSSRSESTSAPLQRLPPVDDPFDPELFNRRFHGRPR